MSEHEQAQMPTAQPSHATTLRHELRTPLNHIIGYSEMLLEEAKHGQLECFSADLQKIHTAGKKLLTLVNAFVGDAKLEGSAPSPAPHTAGRLSHLRDEETYDEASVQPAARSGHLVVVDDNEINRDMLSRRLRQQGYLVSQPKRPFPPPRGQPNHRPARPTQQYQSCKPALNVLSFLLPGWDRR